MGLLIIFFVVSIVVSFMCSIWEAVILSVTPTYTSVKIQEGSRVGQLLEVYKRDIDRPLAAILSLNTIAHTVGAIGVGAQAGKLFGTHTLDVGLVYLSYESVIAGAMTLAILILSEIIPKTLGANLWRQLTPFTIKSLRVLLIVLAPLVWITQWITRSMKKDKDRSILSRADLAALTIAGLESGVLDKSESAIIQNLLYLRQIQVRDIMTPRSVMLIANANMTLNAFYEQNEQLPFSRIPMYEERPDHIIGMFLKNDMLKEIAEDDGEQLLKDFRRDVLMVKDDDRLPKLLESLARERAHIAVVMDSYGSVVGLVTMEDLLETILGFEIVDESDKVADLQGYARRQWEQRARKAGLISDEDGTDRE